MNVTFNGAVSDCFAKYATFTGRSRRAEYWYFALFGTLVDTGFSLLEFLMRHVPLLGSLASLLSLVVSLALLLPTLTVGVRRLHDIDKSGWWIFLGLVPVVGWIIVLVWLCTRGTYGPNRFGADPLPAYP